MIINALFDGQELNMRQKSRLIIPSLLILTLAGCQGIIAAEGASTVFSGKTVSDHIVSLFSGKDCSITNTERGNSYCVEDDLIITQPTLYCYKTLASVSCYTEPDPGRTPDQIVGGNGLPTSE